LEVATFVILAVSGTVTRGQFVAALANGPDFATMNAWLSAFGYWLSARIPNPFVALADS
jgi:hypothetical protein